MSLGGTHSTVPKVQAKLLAAEHGGSQNTKALLTGPDGKIWHIEILNNGEACDLQNKIKDIEDLFNEIFKEEPQHDPKLVKALKSLTNGQSLDIQEEQDSAPTSSCESTKAATGSIKSIQWFTQDSQKTPIENPTIRHIWDRLFPKRSAEAEKANDPLKPASSPNISSSPLGIKGLLKAVKAAKDQKAQELTGGFVPFYQSSYQPNDKAPELVSTYTITKESPHSPLNPGAVVPVAAGKRLEPTDRVQAQRTMCAKTAVTYKRKDTTVEDWSMAGTSTDQASANLSRSLSTASQTSDPQGSHSRLHLIFQESLLLLSNFQSETPQDSNRFHFEWALLDPVLKELFRKTLNEETLSIFQEAGHLNASIEYKHGMFIVTPFDFNSLSGNIPLLAGAGIPGAGSLLLEQEQLPRQERSLVPTSDHTHSFGMREGLDIQSWVPNYLQTSRPSIALPPLVAFPNVHGSSLNVWHSIREQSNGVDRSGNQRNVIRTTSLEGRPRYQLGGSELFNVFGLFTGHRISIGLNGRPVAQRAPWRLNSRDFQVRGPNPESRVGIAPAVSPHLEQARTLTADQAAPAAKMFRSSNPLPRNSSPSQPLPKGIIDTLKRAAGEPQCPQIKFANLQELQNQAKKFQDQLRKPDGWAQRKSWGSK